MHTLQDDGYIIKDANLDLGLLVAQKEVDVENSGLKFLSIFAWGPNASWDKNAIIEASTNVGEYGKQTRVRVNFQHKVLNNHGGVSSVNRIEEPTFYQEFFDKVEQAVFLSDVR